MKIAIIGATGLVGREILKILNEKQYTQNNNIYLYSSKNSDGKCVEVGNKKYIVQELCDNNLEAGYNFALFSAGSEISKKWAEKFVSRGAYVIDNSSAFRRDNDKQLIVPEINYEINKISKIIANPNCSTIGASLPIFAMSKLYKIKRIIISTYQSVSGAGQKGVLDLIDNTCNKFNYKIQNNLIPHIDKFLENGYTFEEDKMEYELKKILNNQLIHISTTCVRVPIVNCHSESINVEFEDEIDIYKIKDILTNFTGIKLVDNIKENQYPMPIIANGEDDVFVGRLRLDTSNTKAINFFISFDNIRKGAALNAVQIMEKIIQSKKYNI